MKNGQVQIILDAQEYSWGYLHKITILPTYESIVIHPDDWEVIFTDVILDVDARRNPPAEPDEIVMTCWKEETGHALGAWADEEGLHIAKQDPNTPFEVTLPFQVLVDEGWAPPMAGDRTPPAGTRLYFNHYRV